MHLVEQQGCEAVLAVAEDSENFENVVQILTRTLDVWNSGGGIQGENVS